MPSISRILRKRIVVVVTFAMLAIVQLGRAATLYWDTDGSTDGNNSSTGANLGGSGIWSAADLNWWHTNAGTPQVWSHGSDGVFWGTAGSVTASTVSANSLAFKTTGYSVNSGTLTMIGPACEFMVDTGIVAIISSTIAGTNTIVKLGAGPELGSLEIEHAPGHPGQRQGDHDIAQTEDDPPPRGAAHDASGTSM